VKAARERCNFVLAATNLDAEPMKPIGGPGACGIAAPIKISAFGNMEVKPPAVLNCRLGATVYKWLTEVVQPAALRQFGEPIVALDNASSYSCRKRVNGFANARISEHSFGNALDIYGFTKVHQGACNMFATVMGPRANVQHENHFHVDLGRGGIYKFCK
jgi:hypothetical protein